MRLQAIADHESRRNEEAGAGHAVEDQEDARRPSGPRTDEPMTEVMNHAQWRREARGDSLGSAGRASWREVERAEQLRDAEFPDRHGPQRLPHALPRAGVLCTALNGAYAVHRTTAPIATKNARSGRETPPGHPERLMLMRGKPCPRRPRGAAGEIAEASERRRRQHEEHQ